MRDLRQAERGENMKSWKKWGAAAVLAVFAGGIVLAPLAHADLANTPKQEMVYANLAADGTLEEIFVVNSFELDKKGTIVDYGNYSSLRNMTTNDEIHFVDETVKIDTKAKKLYYEGRLDDRAIPWDLEIHYYLNGEEYTAEEICGQSGDLKITIAVRKNAQCSSSFFENYALQVNVLLDTELCRNIQAEGATVANVGTDRQLTYTILPNNEKDIVISAEVTDFVMDSITANGLALNLDIELDEDKASFKKADDIEEAVVELDDGALELKDGALEVRDGAEKLQNGAENLKDGAEELTDGALEVKNGSLDLVEGIDEAKNGACELKDGALELADGAAELKDGAGELKSGINSAADGSLELFNGIEKLQEGSLELKKGAARLDEGLNTLAGESEKLNAGAYQIFSKLLAQAQEELNAELSALGQEPVELTVENYSEVLNGLLDQFTNGAYSQAEQAAKEMIREQVMTAAQEQIACEIEADEQLMAQITAQVEAACGSEIAAAAQNYAALQFAQEAVGTENAEQWLQSAEGQAAAAEYLASENGQTALVQAEKAILAQYVAAAVEQAAAEQLASAAGQEQIEALVVQQLASEEVQAQIKQQIEAALGDNQAYNGLLTVKNQLDEYQTFYNGLKDYTAGVDEAADGAAELADGASEIFRNAGKLYDGADKLYSALIALQKGSAKLLDGTITLHDRAIELYNGAVELEDGTVELLNGAVELSDGTIELYDGTVELKDGVIELLDGAIELYEGTVELYDGTVKLTDATWEFREKTGNLSQDLKDEINASINEMVGGDFRVVSFVSEKNTRVQEVQFVIKTTAVSTEEDERTIEAEEVKLTFWQKLLRLFGLY